MKNINVFRKSALAALLLGSALAFAAPDQQPVPPQPIPAPQPVPPEPVPPQPEPAPLSQGEVLGFLSAVHTAQIQLGNMGLERAEAQRVLNFSEKMVRINMEGEEALAGLETTVGESRGWSDAAASFQLYADNLMADLFDERGADFDEDYIEAEISLHQVIVAKIDSDLLPSATTPELSQHLQDMRKEAMYNLNYARDIKRDLDRNDQD